MKKNHALTVAVFCSIIIGCEDKDNNLNLQSDLNDQYLDESTLKVNNSDIQKNLYASIDSTFSIENESYRVLVSQYDMSEDAYRKGDTLPRPTYVCYMEIFSSSGTILLQDSLYRNSWDYAGKIESIYAYQIELPQLHYENDEIIAEFSVYEMTSMDAITGSLAYNVKENKSRKFWIETKIDY